MPITHTIIQDGNAVITIVTGTLTGEDMTQHMFWLIERLGSTLNSGYRQLFDASRMVDLTLEKEDINRIAQIIQTYGENRGKIKTGIVTTLPKGRQMGFAYQALSRMTDVEVKIYDTVEEAMNWLKILPDEYRLAEA